MNGFVINYTAHCNTCNTNTPYSKVLLSHNNWLINPDFEIENPLIEKLIGA